MGGVNVPVAAAEPIGLWENPLPYRERRGLWGIPYIPVDDAETDAQKPSLRPPTHGKKWSSLTPPLRSPDADQEVNVAFSQV